ncbi:MAG: protein kinase [Planctomycetes bacterium]|nr:protein kinase [Planctomycetota bacterium]
MNHCDQEQLQRLLDDQLPDESQVQIVEHLSQCDDCRHRLEILAGDRDWWNEVSDCFQMHRHDPASAVLSGESSANDMADERVSSMDFVVDYLEPCDRPRTLGRLGEYEILEVIGRGGMGIVLKGFHPELARYVAVKLMAPHLASSGAARQRFVREARAAAAIVHPHVMPIHAVCTSARLPFLVMPFVACESLQQRLDRQGPLEVAEVLRIGMQVALALAASHAQGLVHRDVKPANILLERGVDRVLLTDFGLARAADDASLTRTGVIAGTPQYMSPEQACGEALDFRSDLFSLGSVMYAMCSGIPPFRAETTLAVLRRITDTRPRQTREVNASVPEWLERMIERLHEKQPERRYASAAEVADLLAKCLAHIQQPLVSPLPESLQTHGPGARGGRTRRIAWGIVGSGLALTGLMLWQFGNRAPEVQDQDTANSGHQSVSAGARIPDTDLGTAIVAEATAISQNGIPAQSPATAETPADSEQHWRSLLESLNADAANWRGDVTAAEREVERIEVRIRRVPGSMSGSADFWDQADQLAARLNQLERNVTVKPFAIPRGKESR